MAENAGQKPQQAEPETTVAKEPQQAEPETTVAKEPQQAFDYQLDRHCSKTCDATDQAQLAFDYQLDRHCSKTIGTNSPLRERRPIQPN